MIADEGGDVDAVARRSMLRLPEQLCSSETRSRSGFVELMQLCESADALGRCLITAVKSLVHTNAASISAKCRYTLYSYCH